DCSVSAASGGGQPADDLGRLVTNRAEEKLVLAGGGEADSWVSVTLSEADCGGTKITVVLAKPQGVEFGGQHGRTAIQRWVREGLKRIDDYLSGVPDFPITTGGSAAGLQRKILSTLVEAGVVEASHPIRGLRQLSRLRRWGFTVAGGYASAAARNPDHRSEERPVGE